MRKILAFTSFFAAALSLGACSSGEVDFQPLEAPTDGAATTGGATGNGGVQPPGSPGGQEQPETNGNGTSTGGGGGVTEYETVCRSVCSDDPPPDQDPSCEDWKSYGVCGQEWFDGYCQQTCGSCTSAEEVCEQVPVTTPGMTPGTPPGTTPDPNPTRPMTGETAGPLPAGAKSGWASRYWDCCKPHCAWPGNGPSNPMKMCSIDDQLISDPNAESSCSGGSAYTCWDMSPWAVSDTLAYGYAATPAGGDDCGKCYQLQFKGTGEHNANDPGSNSLAGKTMIVQSTNIGGDVGSGQFDLLIPGGGVGAFNGCSKQWGTEDLGAQYGGFLTACNDDVGCLKNACTKTFTGKPDLLAGCLFHVEWMKGANNPQLNYAEVPCPAALEQVSGMSR